MKKIVILSAFASPFRSGAEACAEEVALRLYKRFDITIVTARLRKELPQRELLQDKVQIIRVGWGYPIDKWLYPFFAPFTVRQQQPDVIHAVLESFAGLALFFCRFICPNAKRILTLQTTNRNFLRGPITRSANVVTAISAALVRNSGEHGRRDIALIPNGIPVESIRRACEESRKVSGRVLFVGRLEPMKGVDVLLRAFAIVAAQAPQSLHLHIVGDGSEQERLAVLATQLRIDGRVTFLGRLTSSALFREYAQAEIFCGLSRSEALGNVFLEAQAAGCAVIGTHTGGIPEIVLDGRTGMLVEPDHPVQAATAIHKIVTNPLLRVSLAEAGIRNAEQYDWNGIAERYAGLYGVQ